MTTRLPIGYAFSGTGGLGRPSPAHRLLVWIASALLPSGRQVNTPAESFDRANRPLCRSGSFGCDPCCSRAIGPARRTPNVSASHWSSRLSLGRGRGPWPFATRFPARTRRPSRAEELRAHYRKGTERNSHLSAGRYGPPGVVRSQAVRADRVSRRIAVDRHKDSWAAVLRVAAADGRDGRQDHGDPFDDAR